MKTESLVIDLRKPNLKELSVGTVVITSKGFNFELTQFVKGKQYWKDLSTGLVWLPKEEEKFSWDAAVAKFNTSLPTIEEFELAEEHGFREVVSDMDGWFWSASLNPTVTDYARGFNGYDGYSYYGYGRDSGYSVRCVSGR